MIRTGRSRAEAHRSHRPDRDRDRPTAPWARTAAVALVVAALVSSAAIGAAPSSAAPASAVQLAARDGVIVATGQGFPARSAATVSAQYSGGSAAAWAPTTATGTFEVAFRLPAGREGEFAVSATSGSTTAEASVIAPRTPPPGAAGGALAGLTVVPTTGTPAYSTLTFVPSGLPVVTVPRTITADCSSDVTERLNDWVASVPDGREIVFGRNGCYRVDEGLDLKDRSNLVIEGNGARFWAGRLAPEGTNRSQWYLEYGNDLTLRNMSLIGVNPEPVYDSGREWDHNLFIRGTQTVTIENVHGRRAYGDFIAIAQGPDQRTIPSDITIRDVSAEIVGRMGISCVACDGVSVENSVFNDIGYHVFDLEIQGNGWPGRSIEYTGNTTGRHARAFFAVGTPFQTQGNDLSDLQISGNVMTMPGSSPRDCQAPVSFRSSKIDAEGVVIEDNVLLSHTTAIDVRRASDVVIRGNTAELTGPTCGRPVGIRLADVDGLAVSGNELVGYPQEQLIVP